MPNSSRIQSDAYKATAINKDKNNLDLSQIQSCLYIFSNLTYMYLYFFSHHKLAINLITDFFSIENSTDNVIRISQFVRAVANHVTKFTAKFHKDCA